MNDIDLSVILAAELDLERALTDDLAAALGRHHCTCHADEDEAALARYRAARQRGGWPSREARNK